MADTAISWTFGQLEARLSELYDIDDDKRTAFQSRLKNFHRLRYPMGFATQKGKAALYSPGTIFEMALAVELTQLGLPPERTVNVLSFNWFPTLMSAKIAATGLLDQPLGFDVESDSPLHNPPSTFVYFDPSALANLTPMQPGLFGPDFDNAVSSFFYGSEDLIREGLAFWTTGQSSRMSLVNITGLIDRLAGQPFDSDDAANITYRKSFFAAIVDWSLELQSERNPEAADDYLYDFIDANPRMPDEQGSYETLAAWLAEATEIDKNLCLKCLQDYYEAYLKDST